MDIQKLIIVQLTKQNGLRFSELKPANIESDKFNYHLKQLLKKRYIIKNRARYFLTTLGKQLVADIDPIDAWGQAENVFKVNVLIIATKQNKGVTEILFKTRSRHPFYGYKTVPGGNINKGETSQEAASRLLLEKTGLEADFKTLGTIRKIFIEKESNQLILDIVFYLCKAENIKGELDTISMEEHYWISLNSVLEYLLENPSLPHKISAMELQEILEATYNNNIICKEVRVMTNNF